MEISAKTRAAEPHQDPPKGMPLAANTDLRVHRVVPDRQLQTQGVRHLVGQQEASRSSLKAS